MYDLAVYGYLAVLQRLKLPVIRAQVGSGQCGAQLPPTLTCDAPLVALGCAAAGLKVHGQFNHPGRGPYAEAARRLLEKSRLRCEFGVDAGEALEWQLLHADGEVTWFNDPARAMRSLNSLSGSLPDSRALYMDAYSWLEPALARLGMLNQEIVWLNLGVMAEQQIENIVQYWRCRVAGQLCVQISQPLSPSLGHVEACAQRGVHAGADLSVVTAGRLGLAVASKWALARQPALPLSDFKDASGAGAAVSVALISRLLQRLPNSPSILADLAARAGQAQCQTDGALNGRHGDVWAQLLKAYDHPACLPA